MIQYGLISKTDALTIEKTLSLICEEFPAEMLYTCEVGVYSGLTSFGIVSYLLKQGRYTIHVGIDNKKDNERITNFPDNPNSKLIIGNSNEVYNQLEDNSQHFIFIDGNHSFPYVISDFYCYAPKVKVGGYFAFHDTAPHAQGKDWQRMGSEADADMYISVRKALFNTGMITENSSSVRIDMDAIKNTDLEKLSDDEVAKIFHQTGVQFYKSQPQNNWQLVFDEADETDNAGGVIVFKKLY